jgi:hypothetical protein
VVTINFAKMTDLKLKESKLLSRPAKWNSTPDQKTTKTTLWGTMSWFLGGTSLLFIFIPTLLIVHSSCSQSRGLFASFPVCVGRHISVQSWLAIVGLEFTILGLIVIPRIWSVLISKFLTWKLARRGLPLATLLNSQTNSPSWTKLCKGLKSTLILRVLVFFIVLAVSILYKFSFVQVGRVDTIALTDAKAPIQIGWRERVRGVMLQEDGK